MRPWSSPGPSREWRPGEVPFSAILRYTDLKVWQQGLVTILQQKQE